ncbi:hypothetical protein [Escherichia coli]|uniref:hypothetical protein n=1 Tax=Escherichia coli TaxID=562 RepID=UPI00234E6809|nr:hypothetical protein [Escherichia coli]WCQ42808.1 hypothetical protein NL420_013850 [Escherichia coli]
MSSKIFYSAGNNTFFFESMKPDYEKSGAWPDDLVAVTNNMYEEFTGRPPEGKREAVMNLVSPHGLMYQNQQQSS